MNGHWTVANGLTRCGYGEGHAVPPDSPVYQMGKVWRCESHAPDHARADTTAIERVCVAAEAKRSGETASQAHPASTPAPKGFASFTDTVTPPRMKKALEARGVRVSAPRPPKPFAAVAGVRDPKSDAFNR